jgi:hypothetical protein
MKDPVLAQLAALKGLPAPALKTKWRALFDSEPPPYNRRFLESRLAYRIQELAYGGLKKETVERLRVLAKQYDGKPGGRFQGPLRSAADRRDAVGQGMAGRATLRHHPRRGRSRIPRPPLQIAVGNCAGDNRRPLERLGILRA